MADPPMLTWLCKQADEADKGDEADEGDEANEGDEADEADKADKAAKADKDGFATDQVDTPSQPKRMSTRPSSSAIIN